MTFDADTQGKVPEKGKPDFSNLSDNQVRQYRDMITDLIGNFSECPALTESLKKAWKYLSDECVDRTYTTPEVEEMPILKKKVFRRPQKNKLFNT